jgi:hypothetical protein
VIVAVQLAFSEASAGGVYVAAFPLLVNVPQPAPLKFQVTFAFVAPVTVAVKVTAALPDSTVVDDPLCVMETVRAWALTVMVNVCFTLEFAVAEAVIVAVQGPIAGGVNFTEVPLVADRLPQVVGTIAGLAPLLAAAAAPLKVQVTPSPLASLVMSIVSVMGAPPAVTVCDRLSPPGSVRATAFTVNTIFLVAEVFDAEVAVIVTVQSEISADSAGGV